MKNKYLLLGVIMIVLTNLFVLVGVFYNKQNVTSKLILTERELSLPFSHYTGKDENSAVSFRLNWRRPIKGQDSQISYDGFYDFHNSGNIEITAEQVIELGFNKADVADNKHKQSKVLYWAFEQNGEQYQKHLANVKKRHQLELESFTEHETKTRQQNKDHWLKELERERVSKSRLFLIDVSHTPQVLHQHYMGRTNILVAKGLGRLDFDKNNSQYSIYLSELSVPNITLSQEMNKLFDQLKRPDYSEVTPPRYELTVNWGQRYEPWISHANLNTP